MGEDLSTKKDKNNIGHHRAQLPADRNKASMGQPEQSCTEWNMCCSMCWMLNIPSEAQLLKAELSMRHYEEMAESLSVGSHRRFLGYWRYAVAGDGGTLHPLLYALLFS